MGHTAETRKRALAKLHQRRQHWLVENGPCRECGSHERLEVDHIDPAEKTNHHIWSWADGRRLAELAKCQVLCNDCHKKKTAEFNRHRQRGKVQPYQWKMTDHQLKQARLLKALGFSGVFIGTRIGVGRHQVNRAVQAAKAGYATRDFTRRLRKRLRDDPTCG